MLLQGLQPLYLLLTFNGTVTYAQQDTQTKTQPFAETCTVHHGRPTHTCPLRWMHLSTPPCCICTSTDKYSEKAKHTTDLQRFWGRPAFSLIPPGTSLSAAVTASGHQSKPG